MVLVIWSIGPRVLSVHQEAGQRVAVLTDGGRLVGMWRLPGR